MIAILNSITKSNKKKILLVATILFIFSLWGFPETLDHAVPGLDPSWDIALQMAIEKHLVWGSDLIFTYGPLGYLVAAPINIVGSLWDNVFFYKVAAHALFLLVSYFFIIKTKYPIRNAISFGIVSILIEKLDYVYFPLLGLIYAYFLYYEHSKRSILLIPISFATAFLFFTKHDLAIGSLVTMMSFIVLLLARKRQRESAITISSYLVFLFIIWALVFGKINLVEYLSNDYNFVSDYAHVMSSENGWLGLLPLLIFSWALLLFWIFYSFKNNRQNFRFIFLSAGVFFLSYKLAFVRFDSGHSTDYLIIWGTLFLSVIFINQGKTFSKPLKYITISIVIIYFGISGIVENNIVIDMTREVIKESNMISPIMHYEDTMIPLYTQSNLFSLDKQISYLQSDKNFETERDLEKQNIRNSYPALTAPILSLISNKTVDIIPWDEALLYAYGLNWDPEPVLQFFNAFNTNLDNLDTKFFESSKSPEFIFYRDMSIDNHIPEFDEPSTIRTLLCNYHVIGIFGSNLILEKNANSCSNYTFLGESQIKFNEELKVPAVENNSYLFAEVYIKDNLAGKFLNTLYKGPKVFIDVNEINLPYRFIYTTSPNGILLKVPSNGSIPLLKFYNYSINSIKFSSDNQNLFESNIKVDFYKVDQKYSYVNQTGLIIGNPSDILYGIYNTRPDLQKAFPEVAKNNLSSYLDWIQSSGYGEYWELQQIKPLIDLLSLYYHRPDLQSAFPEVEENMDMKNLVGWALNYGVKDNAILNQDKDYFISYSKLLQ